MILADYEAGMPIRKLVRKYKLSAHRIAEIVAYRGNRQPPLKRYTVITALFIGKRPNRNEHRSL